MMKIKKIFVLLIMFILILCGCENKEETKMPKEDPIITMNIKDFGTIKIELYPKIAFNTVANFVNLTQDGFYDNNTIHRVQKGFVIQGGDPTGTGTGGPGYTIKGEFNQNGFKNDLSHTKGIISMARTNDPDSAGSQFFIVLSDDAASSLDGMYAAFGKVIEGIEIIEKIENTNFEIDNAMFGTLKNPITIESVTVDTKGYDYKVVKN